MKEELKDQLITGILSAPIIYIPHFHYQLVDDVIRDIVKPETSVLDLTIENIGEFDLGSGSVSFDTKNIVNPNKLEGWLKGIITGKDRGKEKIFIVKNIHKELEASGVQSLLQNFAAKYEREKEKERELTIVIVAPVPVDMLPLELQRIISVIDILPPSELEIQEIINKLEVSLQYEKEKDSIRMDFCRTLQGLHLYEINQIIRSTLVRTGEKLTQKTIQLALEEKKRIVKKSGIIEVIDSDVQLGEIGGLEALKDDIEKKAVLFRHLSKIQSKKINIILPKGILILGMPGCGKSMISKAIANEFGVSLLRLDVSRLMGQYVGQSEFNLRKALQTAEAAHPCVLWIDEVEKAFAGSNGRDNDMLVMRLMGHFLTWMQERKTAVYIVATANDVMRPEFMRKGRFDEVYFVDFPNKKERLNIYENKCKRYIDTKDHETIFHFDTYINWANIAEESKGKNNKGFSGSEIECVINTVIENKTVEYLNKLDKDEKIEYIQVSEEDFLDVIDEVKTNVMSNQEGKIDNLKKELSAIERIRELQNFYHFKTASK